MKIYFYKLTVDDGGAPCVKDGLLSLAICKPSMRSTAEPDNLVFGFAADSLHPDNRLIYCAKVTDKLGNGDYFRLKRYRRRGDCIYEWHNGRFLWRSESRYHGPTDLQHDLGSHPNYPRANVLVSAEYRYFGGGGSADYKPRYPRIKHAIENLGRGHRVHHSDELRQEVISLGQDLFARYRRKSNGRQTTPPNPNACHRNRDCGVLK